MKYHSFLLKYGEIGVKGKNRFLFEDALAKRVRIALKSCDGEFTVHRENGRIYADVLSEYDEAEVFEALKTVFGLVAICPVLRLKDEGFEKLKESIVAYFKDEYGRPEFTFKVECKRTRKNYPIHSQEINALIGETLLENFGGLKVDVHNPQVLLSIEVRENYINVYSREEKAAGGMPLGVSGKGMLLLSGGIDSPVAGYMMAKRGMIQEACYFHAPPYTSERAKQKVVDLAKIISRYTGPILLHIVPFTEVQLKIYELCPHAELTIIMRRYMMKIAEEIAKKNDCQCLITGESIAQVASQTTESLACTNAVCTLPVFRPLIAFDKQEIVNLSHKIRTYETSILPFEDCCTIFVAKHPVTKPELSEIEKSEETLKGIIEPLVQESLSGTETVLCRFDKTLLS